MGSCPWSLPTEGHSWTAESAAIEEYAFVDPCAPNRRKRASAQLYFRKVGGQDLSGTCARSFLLYNCALLPFRACLPGGAPLPAPVGGYLQARLPLPLQLGLEGHGRPLLRGGESSLHAFALLGGHGCGPRRGVGCGLQAARWDATIPSVPLVL